MDSRCASPWDSQRQHCYCVFLYLQKCIRQIKQGAMLLVEKGLDRILVLPQQIGGAIERRDSAAHNHTPNNSPSALCSCSYWCVESSLPGCTMRLMILPIVTEICLRLKPSVANLSSSLTCSSTESAATSPPMLRLFKSSSDLMSTLRKLRASPCFYAL